MKTSVTRISHALKYVLSAIVFLAGIGAQAYTPDHYVSYSIRASEAEIKTISLHDQFSAWTDFAIDKPEKLLNPATNEHNGFRYGIKDAKLHYAAYPVTPVDSSFEVLANLKVANQFGEFTVNTQFLIDF